MTDQPAHPFDPTENLPGLPDLEGPDLEDVANTGGVSETTSN